MVHVSPPQAPLSFKHFYHHGTIDCMLV